MIAEPIAPTESVVVPSVDDVMRYEAPFLIDKLIKERIVDTREEAAELFDEVKRYLVMARTDRSKLFEMYSLRIDEVWHQFILFTNEYMDFCRRYFGHYVPHSPGNAPKPEEFATTEVATFEEFAACYAEFYGEPLPGIWHDETSVTINRRIMNDNLGVFAVRRDGDMVELITTDGDLLMRVNDFASEALEFIARTGAFYVRELPGDLDDEEKVAIVATLVKYFLLRVGS